MTGTISRVGPKGYIHGWIFVGAPGAGDQVFHPHHGHGTVTEAGPGHVRVRFESGDHRAFPVRPDRGPGHFERMTDGELANELNAGQGQRFHHAVAELDRRDRAEKVARVKNLYAEKPKSEADRNRVYQNLVNEGENPEDAWSHAHGVDSEQMQRQAVIAQLKDQGYKGSGFDALSRDAFKHDVQRRVLDAETATNGYMLSREGQKAGIDPWSLFTGPEARARKYASSELREWWDQNGRPTAADFQSTLMGHAASAGGPRGGDFYRSASPEMELRRSASPAALPGRAEVLARARTEGHRAGCAYRDNGTMPETPGDFTRGPRLVRQAASEWHRGFEDGRGTPAPVSRAVTSPGGAEGTERLHQYWVHGEGAAKIRWGEGGDFDRCVMHLGKFMTDPKGYCAKAHHEALGIWPATHAAMEKHAGRADMATTMQAPQAADDRPAFRAEFMRLYALEDIHILRSADGGDGRTVEAYAAVFNEPAEIQDHEGHYVEVIEPSAFNRAIEHASRARGGFPGSVKVLWNHGRDLSGKASDRFSMPIGVPVDIRAESRGLLTRTRYADTPLADEVLENIRAGAITSQSFTGAIMRSTPQLRRGDKYRPRGDDLTTVRRTELGLREYGPVLWPAYSGAEIVGVRMSTPGSWSPDPDEHDTKALPPDEGLAPGDPLTRMDGEEHSARYHQHALYALRSQELREEAGLAW